MTNQFSAFIDDLRSTHGSNLVSVILYGSAAAGDFVPERSDYNLLIALNRIGPEDLRRAHACIREWSRLGHPVPVYFTTSELKNAGDVFPIEFHQMKDARKVLYGDDLLAEVEIKDHFLRLQTEFELRSKLLMLRRQYIPATSSLDKLVALMAESLGSFAAIFRAVLIVKGVAPPTTKHEILDMTVKHLGIDRRPFDKIFAIRENTFEGKIDDVAANELFGEYLGQIERVIDEVDSINRTAGR
jgi:predicted nucleotidyltransferase